MMNFCKFCCCFLATVFALVLTMPAQAQIGTGDTNGSDSLSCSNIVGTAIPFLRINPDAATGGLGEAGIATMPNAAAIYHNASKLAFIDNQAGLTLSYTPWLKQLVDDIFIAHLAGYYKADKLQSLGLSLRYFSLGNITFTDIGGNITGQYNPNEFAIDVAYARKLSNDFGMGITLKYIRSDLAKGQEINSGNIARAAQAAAADISMFYRKKANWFGQGNQLNIGAALTNIGKKVSYSEENVKDFIPINLGVAAALNTEIDDHNSILFTTEINKLMTPTPTAELAGGDPNVPDWKEKSLLSGMFGSFSDAPDGAGEELSELMYSVGLEYLYNKQFALRAGHFNESKCKGNRKYFTLGLGLKYSVFGFNFAYIIPSGSGTLNSPLDNTLRFGFTFDLNDKDDK